MIFALKKSCVQTDREQKKSEHTDS